MSQPQSAYTASGVDYEPLDAFKRLCQRAAGTTANQLVGTEFRIPASVRGESAFLLETTDSYLAHVEEGLGTKNLVADAMAELTGRTYYHTIGIDTVAMIVNDLITAGALPTVVAMHAAVGDTQWFADTKRAEALIAGFADGCRQSGAIWGGGETPALKGIIEPRSIVLAGSAVGFIKPKSQRITGNIQPGDAIILLASNGIHSNGITLCRRLAEQLPDGYLTRLSNDQTFGEALLQPTAIYAPFIRHLFDQGMVPHYAVHITGHGWRKLMRAEARVVYRVTAPPPGLPLFEFLCEAGQLSRMDAFGTFNMGAGFAVYVPRHQVDACLDAADAVNLTAWVGGEIVEDNGRKAVEIVPYGITFDEDSLDLKG